MALIPLSRSRQQEIRGNPYSDEAGSAWCCRCGGGRGRRSLLRAGPEIPTTAVNRLSGRGVNPAWSRRTTPTVLGVTPIELSSGHSRFLIRPELLADGLERLA